MVRNPNIDPEDENYTGPEKDFERVLRPQTFDDFTGQEKILENLKVFVKAAVQREEALDHVCYMALRAWVKQPYLTLLHKNWAAI